MTNIILWERPMTKMRTWNVRANSFARPDYQITGTNLRDAVIRNINRIIEDVARWAGDKDLLGLDMRWRKDILQGQGGAELEIQLACGDNATHFVVWIGSSREETPQKVIWKKSGNQLTMLQQVA